MGYRVARRTPEREVVHKEPKVCGRVVFLTRGGAHCILYQRIRRGRLTEVLGHLRLLVPHRRPPFTRHTQQIIISHERGFFTPKIKVDSTDHPRVPSSFEGYSYRQRAAPNVLTAARGPWEP